MGQSEKTRYFLFGHSHNMRDTERNQFRIFHLKCHFWSRRHSFDPRLTSLPLLSLSLSTDGSWRLETGEEKRSPNQHAGSKSSVLSTFLSSALCSVHKYTKHFALYYPALGTSSSAQLPNF